MMGKGAEGGCTRNGCNGSTNMGLLPFYKGVIQSGSTSRMRGSAAGGQGLDVFSQVLKSLAIKPAFGELGSAASNSSLSAPISSENRRKQRVKRNDMKDSFENSWYKDSNGGPFWLEMEEYFREPTPQDIQLLLPKTKLDTWSLCNALDSLLRMPVSGFVDKEIPKQESSEGLVLPSAFKQNSMPLNIHCQEDQMSLCDLVEHVDALRMHEQQQPTKRKLVATGSASKRRKLTSSAFDIVTAVISPPENGDEELCHVCYGGDSDEHNQILFCDSCNVAVHQECYGIKVVPEDQWLCSPCNYRTGTHGEVSPKDFQDCVLCPVKGGALKLISPLKEQPSKDRPKAAFAHLFCCQWIPETYIGDMEVMEPVMNVEGVREERWKLLCSICKDKHGACIQCSHGLCATAFHPLCARQTKFRMEISSKANGDELDFRAFCSKHTIQGGKPPVNMRAENEGEHGAHDAINIGETVTESSLNKLCKKLKAATSKHEDDSTQAGAGAAVNNVGFMKNNLFLRRGMVVNGGLASNVVKGFIGPTDSMITVDEVDVNANHTNNYLLEQSHATSQNLPNQMGMPHDRRSHFSQGSDLSDRGVHGNLQSWILDSSCTSDIHNQLPPLAGRNSTKTLLNDEPKQNINVNGKDSLCRTYRNKRRKLEQQALVSQLQPKEETLLSSNQGVVKTGLVEGKEMQRVGFGSQNMWDAISTRGDQTVEVHANLDEDRRQRGLSGEASTSQDIPSTSQLPAWMVQKGQDLDLGAVFVLEQKSTLRPGHGTNIHPFLLMRLLEIQSSIAERGSGIETGRMLEDFQLPDSFLASASPCIEVQQIKVPRSKRYQCQGFAHKRNLASKYTKAGSSESLEAQLKQLEHAKKIGILDMAPKNELEGEIIALQLKLIAHAQGNLDQCERLVLKIVPTLSKELRAHWRRSKDLAFVTHYLSMLREAKKQGRKERRSKEAQAVLAVATAVAAASSRLGGLRKDAPGSYSNDEKPYLARDSFCPPSGMATSHFGGVSSRPSIPKPTSYGWTSSSQTSSCGKASSMEHDVKPFDSRNNGNELNSGESREQLIICDICKDSSFLNPTTSCHRCKVVVHQQCYGVDGVLKNDWLCQPCTEVTQQFQGLKASDVTDRATPGHGVACSLCFGQSGAFKKSADSKWVHVFCAEWVPDAILDKDDGAQHESLKLVHVERILQECSICHTKQGARLRCSFGHCHGSFHPLCARDSGLYMSVKRSPGGRIQHRAYCEKHSSQQRQKAASRKYGNADELSMLLQMRAELERVRILCERVCKRERIKRDSLLCTLDIYTAHLSSLSSSAMASNDLSSTSNTLDTTLAFRKMSSLHKHQNDSVTPKPNHGLESESYSWNSVAGEGNRYQDSLSGDSVYQTQISCSEPSRETPARSQLSDAAAVHGPGRLNIFVGAMAKSSDQKRLGKHQKAETLHTEVVMTPTEASVQNQRLPKGYAYVPVGTLPKGKMNPSEASALKDL